MNLKKLAVNLTKASAVAAVVVSVPAWAAVQTNITVPVSGTVINPCNGETLNFSGSAHFNSSVTLSGSGGFHLAQHDNIHVTATGDQGNTYVGNEEDSFELNGTVGIEETATDIFTEISRGSAPNFVQKAVFHVTVNPNGTVTAFVNDFTAQCRG